MQKMKAKEVKRMEGGVTFVVVRRGAGSWTGLDWAVAKRRNNNNSDQRVASARLYIPRQEEEEQEYPWTAGLMAQEE